MVGKPAVGGKRRATIGGRESAVRRKIAARRAGRLAVETPRGAKMREVDNGLVRLAYGPHAGENLMWQRRTVGEMPREVSHPIIVNKPADLAGMERKVIAHLTKSGANYQTREETADGIRIKSRVPYGKSRFIPVSVALKVEGLGGPAPRNAFAAGEAPTALLQRVKGRILSLAPRGMHVEAFGGLAEIEHKTGKGKTHDVDLRVVLGPGEKTEDAAARMERVLRHVDEGGNDPITGDKDWRRRHLRVGSHDIQVHMLFEAGERKLREAGVVGAAENMRYASLSLGRGGLEDAERLRTLGRYIKAGLTDEDWKGLAGEYNKMGIVQKGRVLNALMIIPEGKKVPKFVIRALEER